MAGGGLVPVSLAGIKAGGIGGELNRWSQIYCTLHIQTWPPIRKMAFFRYINGYM